MRLTVLTALPALLLALALGACATNGDPADETRLLLSEDYRASVAALRDGKPDDALAAFPTGETGTFITTMERTYLHLLAGRAEIDELIRFRDLLADRVRIHVTREVKSLFYVETPEGYYASEHEIVWMHLLLSWGFTLRGQPEAACVEARQASHLLTARWSEEGHFDDPTLRAILGALWAACGDWAEAQVDFRRAAELDPSLTWAAELGARTTPPRHLFLVLGGVGPEPVWDAELQLNVVRGARRVAFQADGRRSTAGIEGPTYIVDLHLTPGSLPWYERHQVRDNAIAEVIGDSHYVAGTTVEAGLMAARTAAAATVGTLIIVGGIVAGAGIVYLAAEAGSGEGVFYGILIGLGIAIKGVQLGVDWTKQGAARFQREANPARRYRFVRFLPEYAWIGWSDAPLPDTLWVTRTDLLESEVLTPVRATAGTRPRVSIGFTPDVD